MYFVIKVVCTWHTLYAVSGHLGAAVLTPSPHADPGQGTKGGFNHFTKGIAMQSKRAASVHLLLNIQ